MSTTRPDSRVTLSGAAPASPARRVTLSSVLTVLGALVALGGYLLLVGSAVEWWHLHELGVPTFSVIADVPRNELIGLGFEAVGAWLLLVLVFSAVVVGIGRTAGREPLAELVVVVVLALLAIGVSAAITAESTAVKAALGAVSAGIFGGSIPLMQARLAAREHRKAALSALALGAILAICIGLLLVSSERTLGFVVATMSVAVAVYAVTRLVALRALRQSHGFEPEWAKALLGPKLGPKLTNRVKRYRGTSADVESRNEIPLATRARRSRNQLLLAVIALTLLLAVGAVVSRSSHDFWIARVATTDGSCLSGTLLVRDSEEVLLTGKPVKTSGGTFNRLVEIPSGAVASVQVIGPPGRPKHIRASSCAQAGEVADPSISAPFPLVPGTDTPEAGPESEVKVVKGTKIEVVRGPRGTRGEAGPRGETGLRGEAGPAGRPGDKGEPGATGETGQRGKRGKVGERGQTGERGLRGEAGPRGAQGPTGRTGPRGKPGPRGETGPRGQQGPSPMDGS
jgi:hypothetical protein